MPSIGEDGNSIAVGYVPQDNYSPLVVSYDELQFLYQLNEENRIRFRGSTLPLPSVPTNVLAYDRYAYSLNNPIRYNDPSGHCPWCIVVGVVVIAGAPVEITAGMVILGTAATIFLISQITPGAQERNEAFAQSLYDLGDQAINGINVLFSENAKRNDENQEALTDLAQEAKQKGGVSEEDAQTLLDWADEYDVIPHSSGIEQHPNRNFNLPHIRIGSINHIPVLPQ